MAKYFRIPAVLSVIGGVLALAALAQSQTPLRFEVASIRPTDIQTSNAQNPTFAAYRAGKATSFCMECVTGNKYDNWGMPLKVLIATAYGIDTRLISGPEWLNDRSAMLFVIRAVMPPGGTREQVPEMIKALLEERFHLAVHRGTAEQTGYALVIGKNGSRLKPPRQLEPGTSGCQPWVKSTIALRDGSLSEMCRMTREEGDGEVNVTMTTDSGWGPLVTSVSRRETIERHTEYFGIAMPQLAEYLGSTLSTGGAFMTNAGTVVQVVDKTGIEGRWDVVLNSSPGDMALSTLSSSLEKLGLRLERTTVTAERLFVDQVDKIPTEN